MQIIGAGMAGLLAAQMLRRHLPTVLEKQGSLPNNHGALLRFRSSAVSEATTIPFQKVRVRKGLIDGGDYCTIPTLAQANAYSQKVTGSVTDRSVINLEPSERYIAPLDFVTQLAGGVEVIYNVNWNPRTDDRAHEEPVISTIPMPVLMKLVEWPIKLDFTFRKIWTLNVRIIEPAIHVFQTLYYPGPEVRWYRASLTGDLLTVESAEIFDMADSEIANAVLSDFGIQSRCVLDLDSIKITSQQYGKLLPIPERERREFVLAMSDQYNIYSVGRFATWRQILLDDVVRDIRIVEQYITQRDQYHRRLQEAE